MDSENKDSSKQIPLPEIVAELGYQIDKIPEDKTWISFINPDTLDKIIVYQEKQSRSFYFINPYDTDDLGDKKDFVKSRMNLSEKEAVQYLEQLEIPNEKYSHKLFPHRYKRNVLAAKYFAAKPLTNRSLLHKIKVQDGVIDSTPFKGRIANDQKGNIIFPISNEKGIVGIDVFTKDWVNRDQQDNGIWISNANETVRPKAIIIVENPVDAMLYHQENQSGNKPIENLYIAFNSVLNDKKLRIIQNIIDKHKPYKVLLPFYTGADKIRFNCNLIGQLSEPREQKSIQGLPYPVDQFDDIKMAVNLIDHSTCELKVNLSHATPVIGEKMVENFVEYMNEKLAKNSVQPDFKIDIQSISKHKTGISVIFPNRKDELLITQRVIRELRPMTYLELIKAKEQKLMENLGKPVQAKKGISL